MSVQIQLHMNMVFGSLIIKSSSARLVCLFFTMDLSGLFTCFISAEEFHRCRGKSTIPVKSDLPLGDEFSLHSFKII